MSLTREQMMERNIDLAEEHLLQVLNYPEMLEHIPDNAHIVFLPTDDPELFETNLQTANAIARELSQEPSRRPIVLMLMPTKDAEPVPA